LNAPDGLGTSPNEFDFFTYDASGNPVLTTDPNGISGLIDVSPEGVISTSAISTQLGIVATPEPSMLWMLCGALGIVGLVRYRRRASQQ
jgi:hypothetical protein